MSSLVPVINVVSAASEASCGVRRTRKKEQQAVLAVPGWAVRPRRQTLMTYNQVYRLRFPLLTYL